MRRALALTLIVAAAIFVVGSVGKSQDQIIVVLGEKTPDFPPGFFTDGGKYSIPEFRGKAVGLYFFDPNALGVNQSVLAQNLIMQSLQGRPVAFLGIASNVTAAQAAAFQQSTGLRMPIFADSLGIMQARYNVKIGQPQNIYQFRLLDSEHKMAGLEFKKEAIEKVIGDDPGDTIFKSIKMDARLAAVAAPFEHGQFPMGMKQMSAARKTAKKADVAVLDKIQAAVKEEVGRWKMEADAAAGAAPITAYDLYAKAAAALPNDEIGKASQASLRKLAEDKSIKAELAARTAFQKIVTASANAGPAQKLAFAAAYADVGKKHRDTPTGVKAQLLADEMGYEPPMPKKKK